MPSALSGSFDRSSYKTGLGQKLVVPSLAVLLILYSFNDEIFDFATGKDSLKQDGSRYVAVQYKRASTLSLNKAMRLSLELNPGNDGLSLNVKTGITFCEFVDKTQEQIRRIRLLLDQASTVKGVNHAKLRVAEEALEQGIEARRNAWSKLSEVSQSDCPRYSY